MLFFVCIHYFDTLTCSNFVNEWKIIFIVNAFKISKFITSFFVLYVQKMLWNKINTHKLTQLLFVFIVKKIEVKQLILFMRIIKAG